MRWCTPNGRVMSPCTSVTGVGSAPASWFCPGRVSDGTWWWARAPSSVAPSPTTVSWPACRPGSSAVTSPGRDGWMVPVLRPMGRPLAGEPVMERSPIPPRPQPASKRRRRSARRIGAPVVGATAAQRLPSTGTPPVGGSRRRRDGRGGRRLGNRYGWRGRGRRSRRIGGRRIGGRRLGPGRSGGVRARAGHLGGRRRARPRATEPVTAGHLRRLPPTLGDQIGGQREVTEARSTVPGSPGAAHHHLDVGRQLGHVAAEAGMDGDEEGVEDGFDRSASLCRLEDRW